MTATETDINFLTELYDIAKESPDLSTANAACLVMPHNHVSWIAGCNEFPSGVAITPERLIRPLKYSYTEHAERSVIYAAAALGVKTRGAIMYCLWSACADCARAIVMSGVKELVTHDTPVHYSRPDWQTSIDIGMTILSEGGVIVRPVKAHLGIKTLFDGNIVEV